MKTLNINNIPADFNKQAYISDSIDNNNIEICFEYLSDFANSVVLRSFVGIICDSIGINGRWKSRLVLIVDELNNNAVEYGSCSCDINSMRFIISTKSTDAYINIEVEDTGKGEFAKKAKKMIAIREKKGLGENVRTSPIRGRGLFIIIDKLVDTLYFKDSDKGGLIVGINKSFNLLDDV